MSKLNNDPCNPQSFSDILKNWQNNYLDILKNNYKLRLHNKKYKEETGTEIRIFLLGLLEIIENFDNLINSIYKILTPEDNKIKRILQNFILIKKQLFNELKRFGISKIETEHVEFVAGLHKAVGIRWNPNFRENIVIETLKEGFFWKNEVIRPAEVIVNKKEENQERG